MTYYYRLKWLEDPALFLRRGWGPHVTLRSKTFTYSKALSEVCTEEEARKFQRVLAQDHGLYFFLEVQPGEA